MLSHVRRAIEFISGRRKSPFGLRKPREEPCGYQRRPSFGLAQGRRCAALNTEVICFLFLGGLQRAERARAPGLGR